MLSYMERRGVIGLGWSVSRLGGSGARERRKLKSWRERRRSRRTQRRMEPLRTFQQLREGFNAYTQIFTSLAVRSGSCNAPSFEYSSTKQNSSFLSLDSCLFTPTLPLTLPHQKASKGWGSPLSQSRRRRHMYTEGGEHTNECICDF